jgi:hypothetical protein
VVIRPDALRERLKRLEEVISRLEELERTDPLDGTDFRGAWAVEPGLLLAAEIVFDVGNHLLSAHFGVSPRDYEDILEQLGARRVIDAPLRGTAPGTRGVPERPGPRLHPRGFRESARGPAPGSGRFLGLRPRRAGVDDERARVMR